MFSKTLDLLLLWANVTTADVPTLGGMISSGELAAITRYFKITFFAE